MQEKFIDIERILEKKNPAILKWIPRIILKYIKRVIHQDDVNEFIIENKDGDAESFSNNVQIMLNNKIEVEGLENLPKTGGVIIVSNHPYGGLDALAIYNTILRVRSDVKFIVNDLLLLLPNLKEVFFGVNKYGSTAKDSLKKIDDLFASDQVVVVFPAGLVSRKIKGQVQDLEWKKAFLTRAKKHGKPILPIFVGGELSKFFYNLHRFRSLIGIKTNLELFYLVDELYNKKNVTIPIQFGELISADTFDNSKSLKDWILWVRNKTYSLKNKV